MSRFPCDASFIWREKFISRLHGSFQITAKWRQDGQNAWSLFRLWGGCGAKSFADDMGRVEQHLGEPAETQRRAQELHSVFVGLFRNRSLKVLRSVPDRNGLEVYRLLLRLYTPNTKPRSMAILSAIMALGPLSLKEKTLQGLDRLMSEYPKAAATAVPEEVALSVLIRCLPMHIKQPIQLNLDETSTQTTIRNRVLGFESVTNKQKGGKGKKGKQKGSKGKGKQQHSGLWQRKRRERKIQEQGKKEAVRWWIRQVKCLSLLRKERSLEARLSQASKRSSTRQCETGGESECSPTKGWIQLGASSTYSNGGAQGSTGQVRRVSFAPIWDLDEDRELSGSPFFTDDLTHIPFHGGHVSMLQDFMFQCEHFDMAATD